MIQAVNNAHTWARSKVAQLQDNALKLSVVAVVAMPGLAVAQTPTPFETVLATITSAVEEYGPALLTLGGIGVVFMVGLKYIKKLRGAA